MALNLAPFEAAVRALTESTAWESAPPQHDDPILQMGVELMLKNITATWLGEGTAAARKEVISVIFVLMRQHKMLCDVEEAQSAPSDPPAV